MSAELGKGLQGLVGRTIGGYHLESLIGQGGMGVVFRGRQLELDRAVAIKFLSPAALKEDHLKRFQREVRVQKSLEHPCVVRVFDTDEHEGLPYIVMELVEGGSLRDWIRKDALPSMPGILSVGIQLFEALIYLHECGVLHRDLKPANVLRTTADRILVSDFGLSRFDQQTMMTNPGEIIGTLTHLAPEVIAGREATPAVDRYAAGLILYEMVTGCLPFRFENPSQWVWAVEKTRVPPPLRPGEAVPPELQGLILDLLAKDPARRVRSEAALACLRALQEESAPAEPPVVETMSRVSTARRPTPEPRPSATTRPLKAAWWRSRTAAGVAATLALLVTFLTFRPGPTATPVDAKPLLEQARKLESLKDPASFEKALALYREAATHGSAEAQYHLGYLADVGEGISQDPAEAARWYRQAVKLGHLDAEARLAILCLYGRGVPTDPIQGRRLLEHSAESGSILAASWLGTRLLVGMGMETDHAKARHWLEKGASAGEPEAQCNMGVMHERGFGVPIDLSRAVYWYSKSAENGYELGRFNLGVMKVRGHGTKKDPVAGAGLIRTAAERGVVQAQDFLGRLYLEGAGVAKDPATGALWLKRSADAFFVPSLEAMGQLHEDGTGVPKDLDRAAFYYKQAQDAGSTWALTRLTNLELGTGRGFLDPSTIGATSP